MYRPSRALCPIVHGNLRNPHALENMNRNKTHRALATVGMSRNIAEARYLAQSPTLRAIF